MTIQRNLPALGEAINHESYNWLLDNLPSMADALQKEVNAGATADQVRRFVMSQTQRPGLALRLYQAAQHLISQAGE